MAQPNPGSQPEPSLDVITIGRSSVDLYGQQIGSRLEDIGSFAKSVGGCPANIAIGTARLGLKSGLITERTKAFYATYVDMDELKAEGDRMIGDDIAEEGIKYLQEINFKDRSNAAAVRIAAE